MVKLILTMAIALQAAAGAAGPEGDVEITILHTGGFMSAFEKAPVLAKRIQEIRDAGGEILLVDTGNHMNAARLETTDTEGIINIDIMNEMGYDAMAIGAGELQFGSETLSKRIRESHFPLLSANLFSVADDRLLTLPFWTRDLAGVRVGIVGIGSLDRAEVHSRRRILEWCRQGQPVSEVKRYIELLRQKVDLLVVLSNSGFGVDSSLLASVTGIDVPGVIDVLIGGFSDNPLDKPIETTGGRMVWAPVAGGYLGKVVVKMTGTRTVAAVTYESISLEGEGSPQMAESIAEYRRWMGGDWDTKVGEVEVAFSASEAADLVADAVRANGRAAIAFCDTAEIIRPFPEGVITKRDLWALLPRKRHVVNFQASGAEIRRFIEENVRQGIRYRLSGVSYVYDPSRPEGEQVTSIRVAREPLRNGRPYACAADDGTAGKTGFIPSAIVSADTGAIVQHALERYLESEKEAIRPAEDERVRREVSGKGPPDGDRAR